MGVVPVWSRPILDKESLMGNEELELQKEIKQSLDVIGEHLDSIAEVLWRLYREQYGFTEEEKKERGIL